MACHLLFHLITDMSTRIQPEPKTVSEKLALLLIQFSVRTQPKPQIRSEWLDVSGIQKRVRAGSDVFN